MSIINWLLRRKNKKQSASKIIKQHVTLSTVAHVEKLLKNLVEASKEDFNLALMVVFYLWLSLEVQILGIPEVKFKLWEGNYSSLLRIIVAKLKAILLEVSSDSDELYKYAKPIMIEVLKKQVVESKNLTPITEAGVLHKYHNHVINLLRENDISITLAAELLFLNWVALSIKINGVPEKIYQQVKANLEVVIQELRAYLVQLF